MKASANLPWNRLVAVLALGVVSWVPAISPAAAQRGVTNTMCPSSLVDERKPGDLYRVIHASDTVIAATVRNKKKGVIEVLAAIRSPDESAGFSPSTKLRVDLGDLRYPVTNGSTVLMALKVPKPEKRRKDSKDKQPPFPFAATEAAALTAPLTDEILAVVQRLMNVGDDPETAYTRLIALLDSSDPLTVDSVLRSLLFKDSELPAAEVIAALQRFLGTDAETYQKKLALHAAYVTLAAREDLPPFVGKLSVEQRNERYEANRIRQEFYESLVDWLEDESLPDDLTVPALFVLGTGPLDLIAETTARRAASESLCIQIPASLTLGRRGIRTP